MDALIYSKQVLIKLCFLILAYLSPVNIIFHAIWFLLVVDLITGIWKSIKNGKVICSRGLRSTVEKVLFLHPISRSGLCC
jgi:hypothetical protein